MADKRTWEPALVFLFGYVEIVGTLLAYTFALYLFILFFLAYRSPLKEVTFYINAFGEADAECVMMVLCLFCMVYSGVQFGIRKVEKKWNIAGTQ